MSAALEPRKLTDRESREHARAVRDRQWRFMERCAEHEPLWFCVWDKRGREEGPDEWLDGLITGLEIQDWITRHPKWFVYGEWNEERYAAPVTLTDAGKRALRNRSAHDMKPVFGGLVEPGWQAIPTPRQRTAPTRRQRRRSR